MYFDILKHNLKQILIAIDQLLNAVICSVVLPKDRVWADETFSAHCWRWHTKGVKWPAAVVDTLALVFGDRNHCKESYESERYGRQLPPEVRSVLLEERGAANDCQ